MAANGPEVFALDAAEVFTDVDESSDADSVLSWPSPLGLLEMPIFYAVKRPAFGCIKADFRTIQRNFVKLRRIARGGCFWK